MNMYKGAQECNSGCGQAGQKGLQVRLGGGLGAPERP